RLTPAAGVVSHVLQLLPPACQFAPTVAAAPAHQWPWLRQALAVTDTGHGRWTDGSRLDTARGAVLPCAAVAPARGGVSTLWGWAANTGRGPEQATCIHTARCGAVTRGQRASGRL